MYYSLHCPPSSFIVLACHAFFIHDFSCQVFSICHFAWVKVASVFLCSAVWLNVSQFVHTAVAPGNVSPLVACVTLFFKAFICSDKRLISCCFLLTVSTEIARLAANSASGPPFDAVCVAAAAILFNYPSSNSIILFVSGPGPAIFWCSRLRSCFFAFFSGAAPNMAEAPKGFSSPYQAASEHRFAT